MVREAVCVKLVVRTTDEVGVFLLDLGVSNFDNPFFFLES